MDRIFPVTHNKMLFQFSESFSSCTEMMRLLSSPNFFNFQSLLQKWKQQKTKLCRNPTLEPNLEPKGTKHASPSIFTNQQIDTTTYLKNEPDTPDTTTSGEDEGFHTIMEAERAVRSRQKELNSSLQHIHERKRKVFTAEKNIAIQKRTLSYYKKELENHCCICGGLHIKSSNHIAANKPNCAAYKMKHQVFLYLSASLKKANLEPGSP